MRLSLPHSASMRSISELTVPLPSNELYGEFIEILYVLPSCGGRLE